MIRASNTNVFKHKKSERVNSMNINSIYGNSTTQNQIGENSIGKEIEKSTNIYQKDSNGMNTEKSPYEVTLQTLESGPVMYEEETKNSPLEVTSQEESEEDKWRTNSERMTEEDYKDLIEEGITLEEYTIEQLERALIRIKAQRMINAESIEQQKQKLDERNMALKSLASLPGVSKRITQKLIEADLPITEANIARISKALDMAGAVLNLSDKGIHYIIKNELEPTIENLYKAQYSGTYYQYQQVSTDTWNSLLPQASEIISNAGMEINEENLNSAKWLVDHKLPLTVNSLWAYGDLDLIKNNTGEEEILNKVIHAFINGNAPESANLSRIDTKRIDAINHLLDNISDEALQLAVNTKESIDFINCRDLKEAWQKIQQSTEQVEVKQAKEKEKNVQENSLMGNNRITDESFSQQENIGSTDIKTITVRRQLEEIRLRLTVESGQRLIKSGIHLETDSLSKIIDGLKEIEDQYYRNLLQENNVAVNESNVELLKDSIESLDQLKNMPSYILGSTLANRSTETVDGLLKVGIQCKQTLDKANETYEALMTSPRSDMGDSITKAFRNVDAILEDLNLDTTAANQRAVRILGYNQMAMTEENILQVKAYDQQVNHMMKSLHPAVTARLIKEGMNPLNTPIEQLDLQIQQMNQELGVSGTLAGEEKYSKYLWKLEKEQKITEEEKRSFIGIYRLLHAVDKTQGAAVGKVIKAGQELTLNNLLSAVRTIKKGGIEASIDDNFGTLEDITKSRESITDQINAAYYKNIIKDIKEEIAPGKLISLGTSDDIMNMSIEVLQDNLISSPFKDPMDKVKEQEYWSEKVKNYRELIEHSEEAIRLLKSSQVPITIENIQAAADLLNGESFYQQWKKITSPMNNNHTESSLNLDSESLTASQEEPISIDTISERLLSGMKNHNVMIEQYSMLEQNVESIITQLYDNPLITSKDIKTLQRISNGMAFLNNLATRESYEIPLAIGEKVTNVNVTIVRNTEETGKVNIGITSESLGKVTINFSIKKEGLKCFITCDNRNGLDTLKSYEETMKQSILQAGIEIKQMNYGIESKTKSISNMKTSNPFLQGDKTFIGKSQPSNEAQEVKTPTEILYKTAKTFLIQISTIEMEVNKEKFSELK